MLTGSTPGPAECLRLLITSGVNLTLNHTGPLMIAMRDEVKLQLLIEGGADVNGRDAEGLTGMHFAASAGKYTSLKLLIEAGADMNTVSHHRQRAMMHAVTYQTSFSSLIADPANYARKVSSYYWQREHTLMLQITMVLRQKQELFKFLT